MKRRLVIGSRGSKLALAQAITIRDQLSAANPEITIDIEVIKTTGDVKTDPLSIIGGKGVFTKELEQALLDGRIDVAVHSLKDLPTIVPEKLWLSAICKRENAHDAIVMRNDSFGDNISIRSLPNAAVIGTSSPRRAAQLKYLRPDVTIRDLRGNIDTRLRKLDEGGYDALILAAAGLHRLNMANRITAIISSEEMLPAVSQGAIGIETRESDRFAMEITATADHLPTRVACTAERALLRGLGGGCQLPIAAYAVVANDQITIDGLVAHPEGKAMIRERMTGPGSEPEKLGAKLAVALLEHGAGELLSEHLQ
ncbi:MAG: hydroxymethylbilane synthase [Acidobacteria bacterium]|nr:MAG: hydroxymethylbilane synthase [Acidobacteriota bacterium]